MRLLLILSLFALCLGCGKSAASNPGLTGTPGGALSDTTPTSCEDAWNQYVAANPTGQFREYKTENHMIVGGKDRVTYRSTRQEKVTESSQERVIISYTTDGNTSQLTMTKTEFLTSCNQGTPTDPTDPTDRQIIEQGNRTITVAAGTFDCLYVKAKILSQGGGETNSETISEMWTSNSGAKSLLVKMVMTTTTKQDRQTMISTMVTELVKYN